MRHAPMAAATPSFRRKPNQPAGGWRLQRFDRQSDPRPYMPADAIAAVEHSRGEPCRLRGRPGAVLVDHQLGGSPPHFKFVHAALLASHIPRL